MTTTNMRTSSLKSALPSPSSGPALTASRSTRRLRDSGSVKGAQSPGLFSSVGTSRRQQGRGSSSFETAEPTSPKVTCIGQVRVKTGRKMMMRKKKKNKVAALNRSRSRRVSGDLGYGRRAAGVQGGICDAVRAFGSEINCFLLCGAGGGGGRSSVCCSRTEDRDKAAAAGGKRMGSSCGAAFARWIMAVHETEEVVGKRELGVEEGDLLEEVAGTVASVEEESDEELVEERRFRRGIRALELLADELQKGRDFSKEGFGGGGMVDDPVCAPPKNALLLMRCRADPVKLSALENRFRESKVEVEDDERDVVAAGGGRTVEDGYVRSAKDGAFAPRVYEVKGKNHHLVTSTADATQSPAVETREIEERDDDKKSSSEGTSVVAHDRLLKSGEEIDEEPQASGRLEPASENEKGGNFPISFSGKSPDAAIREEDKLEGVDDSNIADEANELEEDDEDKQVLVESLREAEDLDAEKENKEEVTGSFHCQPEKPEKKLIRRDLLLASGDMEGRRWSFSKDREPSVDGGRRHSFSTEVARRSSSFREKDVIRRSSFSHDATGELIRRSSSFSSADRNAVGIRVRRSVSKEKDLRRRSVDESAEPVRKPAAATESGTTAATGTSCRRGGVGIQVQESGVVGGQDMLIKRRGSGGGAGDCIEEGSEKEELPDCLRLMMYEPKLSMEISQETWVCTGDFQRWKPNRRRRAQQQQCQSSTHKPADEPEHDSKAEQEEEEEEEAKVVAPPAPAEEGAKDAAEETKGNHDGDRTTNLPAASRTADAVVSTPLRPAAASRPPLPLPPQPPSAPPELAAKSIDRKLDSATAAIAAAFGPLVLTRCKSEPMRNSPRLLMPEDYCFWKSRHHDHRQAVGAAGVGFGF